MKARVTVTLGRELGCDTDEADFDAWVSYVCDRIDETSGCDVTVETRMPRDIQDDDVRAQDLARDDGYPAALAVTEALCALWDDFCADTGAWPKRA